MTFFQNIRLGLLHVALAVTFVAINSVLNRIMIYEMALPASVVASLVILPYVLSPMQVWIGQYSDHHPFLGYRRTPYIALGLVMSLGGMMLTPYTALLMDQNFWMGLLLGIVVFLVWGIGYNLAVVSYLSLASDLSNEQQRSRVIAVMWFMMVISVIVTAILLGRALEPYGEAQLVRAFAWLGLVGLILAAGGLIGLEPRYRVQPTSGRHSNREALQAILGNPQARIFFVYLILLLTAILGQDILLEPFGAQAFGMSVAQTTRLTAIWGVATLASLLLYGLVFNRWMSKKQGALIGGILVAAGLSLIAASGMFAFQPLFVPGVALLGFGTGMATSTNLALMLDMTTSEQAGLFIGAWGVAESLARGVGNLLGGLGRDMLSYLTGNLVAGYVCVFLVEALMICVALVMLRSLNVRLFRDEQPSLSQIVAMAGDT